MKDAHLEHQLQTKVTKIRKWCLFQIRSITILHFSLTLMLIYYRYEFVVAYPTTN
jgi:hypothetical protein